MLKRVYFSALIVSAVFALPAAQAQFSSGIFAKKTTVELKRTLPPITDVHGKTVSVAVERDSSGGATAELQSLIENLLTRSDSAVHIEDSNPDFKIDCRISVYNKPEVTSTVSNNVTTYHVHGAMSVAFRITDPRSGHVLTSGVASKEINEDLNSTGGTFSKFDPFHKGNGDANAKSALSAENVMVGEVARQIASYLVNTTEGITVLLATNKTLDPPNKLAVGNLWSRALEEYETMTPSPDAHVDAYRTYNIGVANEALAYQAQDQKAAVKYLQQASNDYGKAIAAKPDEKYFIEPQDRIRTALAHYTDLTKAPGKDAPPAPSGGRGVSSPTAAAEAAVTNDDVIAMVVGKMDQANILDNIQSAPKVDFDLSIAGQMRLTHNGVSGPIITAMKNRVRGVSTPAAAPPAATKPAPATRPATRKPATGTN